MTRLRALMDAAGVVALEKARRTDVLKKRVRDYTVSHDFSRELLPRF